ncbi:hypothetical protein ACW0KB_17250, partial [Virgibacillus salarius]
LFLYHCIHPLYLSTFIVTKKRYESHNKMEIISFLDFFSGLLFSGGYNEYPNGNPVSLPTREFLVSFQQKFGVGIEPTRTGIAGGAPFAFPI